MREQFIEQRTLSGGADLQPVMRRGKRRKVVHTDGRRIGFAAALALVIEHGKRAKDLEQAPAQSTCPRCGVTGSTAECFGVRVVDGQARAQSWCRGCRSAHVPTAESRLVQEAWDFARDRSPRKAPRPLLEATSPSH